MWSRGQGLDVVNWKNDTNSTFKSIHHSLGKKPSMIWLKDRDNTSNNFYQKWKVWHSGLTPINGVLNSRYIVLNTSDAETNSGNMWGESDSDINENSFSYYTGIVDTTSNVIAILFASIPGISAVGSYTGNGSTGQTIPLTFQPRFLIIKNIDTAAAWEVLDTTRGWGSGNDNHIALNSDSAQSADDMGAPTENGFTLVNNYTSTNLDGDKFIFYAHA